MNGRASITLIAQALLFSAAVLVLGNGKSYAQSDMDDVKAVVDGYHAALMAVDVAKMEALWAHDDTVMDVEPTDKAISLGWDAVKKNLDAEFGSLAEVKLMPADGPHIQVKGDMARSIGITNAAAKTKAGGAFNSIVLETDTFEKRDGHWLLLSHTATPLPH